ncbi:MAG: hypothetical protein ACM3JJ_02305 [Hyphomicrobiales bacterium]
MKRFLISVSVVALVLASAPRAVLAAGEHMAAKPANPAFEMLKSLVGTWSMKDEKGNVMHVKYELVAGGTTLMESLEPAGEPLMVTMYHPDGANLVMTHYCDAGNQPRMRAVKPAAGAKTISFRFLDVANLTSPKEGYMHDLDITLEDADHMTQVWTWKGPDKTGKETFVWTREAKG